MDDLDAAPTAGIVACLLVLTVLAAPYLLVEASGVGTYYAAGAVTPLVAALFALVGIIVFAAGREERSDPPLVAGAALVFGTFLVLVCGIWAATVPGGLVLQLGEVTGAGATFLEWHRWLLVAIAAVVPLAAGWYARALGLV